MSSRIHRWMGPIQIQRSRSRGLWLPYCDHVFLEGSLLPLPTGINTPSRHSSLIDHSTKPLLCRIFSRAPAVLTPFAAFKPTRPATPVSLLPPFLISSVSFSFLSPAVVFAAASPNAPREMAENALSLALPVVKPTGWLARSDPSGAVEATGLGSEPPWLAALSVLHPVSRRASRPLGVDFPCPFSFSGNAVEAD